MECETILETVKSFIGLETDYKPFDSQLIILINSAFQFLGQIGVLSFSDAKVTGTSCWDEFCFPDSVSGMIRHYICLKTKFLFDAPASSTMKEIYQSELQELEWRINAAVDPGVNQKRID